MAERDPRVKVIAAGVGSLLIVLGALLMLTGCFWRAVRVPALAIAAVGWALLYLCRAEDGTTGKDVK